MTSEIRDVCEKRSAATELLGPSLAIDLERTLADFEALDNAAEIFEMFPSDSAEVSDHEREFKLDDCSIIYRSGHSETPNTKSGGTDWINVKRLCILTIAKQHA